MSDVIDDGSCWEVDEVDSDVPAVVGSEAMFNEFIGRARELRADAVSPFRGNVSIVFHNVERGVRAVMPYRETMAELPGIDVGLIERLPNLALALAHAQAIVERAAGVKSSGEIRTNLSRAAALRRVMLLSLETCAEAGLIPKAEVKPIRSGSGPLDLTGDLVACVALFRKYESVLKNKTPITPEQLHEASEVGTALQMTLKPAGTPTPKGARTLKDMEDDRNRLWTLLLEGYSHLRKVAGFLWGDDASKHVPALQSRLRVARKPSPPAV